MYSNLTCDSGTTVVQFHFPNGDDEHTAKSKRSKRPLGSTAKPGAITTQAGSHRFLSPDRGKLGDAIQFLLQSQMDEETCGAFELPRSK